MTLAEAKRGDTLIVLTMPSGLVRAQMLRLGIYEGSEVTCALRMPAGPLVVRRDNLEVALGRKTASCISVRRCSTCTATRTRRRGRWRRGRKSF